MSKLITYIIVLLVGVTIGGSIIDYQWEKDKLKRTKELNIVLNNIRDMELAHRSKEIELITTMNTLKETYEKDLININNDYSFRLLKSNERAERYRNQAQNTAECPKLAEYTAKLDRSLEEGRNLVKEFRITSRNQHEQLMHCVEIIKNDRNLLKD